MYNNHTPLKKKSYNFNLLNIFVNWSGVYVTAAQVYLFLCIAYFLFRMEQHSNREGKGEKFTLLYINYDNKEEENFIRMLCIMSYLEMELLTSNEPSLYASVAPTSTASQSEQLFSF